MTRKYPVGIKEKEYARIATEAWREELRAYYSIASKVMLWMYRNNDIERTKNIPYAERRKNMIAIRGMLELQSTFKANSSRQILIDENAVEEFEKKGAKQFIQDNFLCFYDTRPHQKTPLYQRPGGTA